MLHRLVPTSQRVSLDDLTDRLDLTAGDARAKRSAFWLMLTLSGVIAIAGVIGDSTATVIGAMIVAPLSTPILGIGLGVVTGQGGLAWRSLVTVVIGAAVVIVLGVVLSLIVLDPASVLGNSQVTGRTSPRVPDLIAAIATGFVGAVAITRKDVGDVLPGVAIAISLVPPLGVVGVCLGTGSPALALGALVLFVSNVTALVIAAMVVLTAAGFAEEAGGTRRARLRVYGLLAVCVALVAIPITGNTLTNLWERQVREAAEIWLADTPSAEIVDVGWQAHRPIIEVRSPDELPPVDALQADVDELLGWSPDVVVVHDVGSRVNG
ncbi:putative hydrophobic protein (TIGR00341 family) [Mumia flava]|uniref:Putative hydrophobic protein (TIGR00341 family) n=1 Tax=Mumia flava TaxID=1348852 RepID=A0A0B2B3A6_9ACTN|nr:TIGR00341 family protein [Mumia flava]PJJ56772.1 putative hydrophobic protein (TIGR00341 family) [Mumia flava]